jgi:hypothetical protein
MGSEPSAGHDVMIKVPGGKVWFLFLFTFTGYAILNRGFSYLGSYPVFIGEITFVFYLVFLRHRLAAARFFRTSAFLAIALLWVYCCTLMIWASLNDLSEAVRNSVFWVYTAAFYLGWRYGRAIWRRNEQRELNRFLIACSVAVSLYLLAYPIREQLLQWTLYTSQGGGVSLIGYYSTLHAVAIGFIFFPLYLKRSKLFALSSALGMMLIIFVTQARSAMVALAVIFIYLLLVERRSRFIRNFAWALLFCVLGIYLYMVLEISIEGVRGQAGIEIVVDAATSILFESDQDTWSGSRTDRLVWWSSIIGQLFESWESALFGLGFDQVLVDRETSPGNVIRYPHNSFVTLLGLSGLIGGALYIYLLAIVVLKIFRASLRRNASPLVRWYPIFAMGWLVSAFFSTVMEAPFHSFVFWSLSGMAYYIASRESAQANDHDSLTETRKRPRPA